MPLSPRAGWVFAGLALSAFLGGMAVQEGKEPPLRLSVELGKQVFEAELDKAIEVEVGGRKMRMKVSAKPTRHFVGGGVEFDYPSHFGFEYDRSVGATIWTFDGNNCMVMLQSFTPMDVDTLLPMVVDSTTKQFGGAKVKRSKTSMELAGKKREGIRLLVTFGADNRIQQDYFGIEREDATSIVLVQDSLTDADQPTKEAETARRLLTKTFKFTK